MIDVHCLIHRDSSFFPLLEKQMKEENVNFYPIINGKNIGAGRVKGFLSGDNPYVSFVDYDDLIQPGIFEKIEYYLNKGFDWVYTDEMLIDEEGNEIQPGWSSNPELYSPELLLFMEASERQYCHHIVAFKKEILRLDHLFIMIQLSELAESYLFRELGRNNNFYHLKEIGYYWRQSEDNVYKQFTSYKLILELLNKELK